MNRGSAPFERVMRKAESLGCAKAAFVFSEKGKASRIGFASIGNGWAWDKEEFVVKKYPQSSVERKTGAASSKSKKLEKAFGLCGSPKDADRALSFSGKRLSIKEGKKEVFWVEGHFSKR
jgi:hypothetical protein